jgi:hypothetical protein
MPENKKFTCKQKVSLYLQKSRQYIYNVWLRTKERWAKFIDSLNKKPTYKQKLLVHFYRSKQHIYSIWLKIKEKLTKFVDSFLFYVLIFGIFLFAFQKASNYLNPAISKDHLYNLGFAITGIIGASIAIIFSFSTFILQSTSDLFSTQYLNKFVQDKKEKYFFWSLVVLTFLSFITPLFIKYFVLEILITILFVAFYLIYSLYKELRTRINPETTLNKIKADAIKGLNKVSNVLKKQAQIQSKIFEYKDQSKDLSVAVQYRSNPNWNVFILENVKYLYEIGLRLLSKNEINSFNLTLRYLHDIYLHHLGLRNGHLIRLPANIWGAYTCDDEGFTSKILEYLESMSGRVIQEKRKENLYYLLTVYENLVVNSQLIKFADKNIGAEGENPVLNIILAYYVGLLEKLANSKENDWVWESIKSISKVSNVLFNNNYNYFVYGQITQIINKLMLTCVTDNKQEVFMKEIVKIYLNQIRIGWKKYSEKDILWKDLFKEIKKNTLFLSLSGGINLSVSDLYIDFHEWQITTINSILKITDRDTQKRDLDFYIEFTKRWSDFLLDFARDTGLENKQVGLPIIQSVENNIRIIYCIKQKSDRDLSKLYKTQFNTLSWYFEKTEKVEDSFLFNLDHVLETLLIEINNNLNDKTFETKSVIDLYISLVKKHFEKVLVGYGYNHPRVIEKLIYIGLIMHKYKVDVNVVIELIHELNKKYLKLNKEYFELKKKEPGLMGPNEFQLCKEIYDLKTDLFSSSGGVVADVKVLLKQEISKSIWDDFIAKIKYCEGVEYKTVHKY